MPDEPLPLTPEQQQWALKHASTAAAIGDARSMVEALYESGILDGITRGVQAKYSKLSHEQVVDAVANAVAALYSSVHGGRKVLDVGAYLWKAAKNQAEDAHRLSQIEQRYDPIPDSPDTASAGDEEGERDKLRVQAIAIARTLLPSLGQANIRAVMEFVIDAVEAGDVHVSNQEIGEALGLNPHTVRTLLSRGFQRLQRVAQVSGLIDLEHELASIGRERANETDDELY